MTEETYNKIIEDIKSMTDEEYKQYPKEAKEMDRALENKGDVVSCLERYITPAILNAMKLPEMCTEFKEYRMK